MEEFCDKYCSMPFRWVEFHKVDNELSVDCDLEYNDCPFKDVDFSKVIPYDGDMMILKERIELYQKAMDTWGVDSQLDMAIEESAEFIVAIQHIRRVNKPETAESLIGEIADVELMLQQIKYIFGIDSLKLSYIKGQKLKRLKKLLEVGE